MSTDHKPQAETVQHTIEVMRESAKIWQATAERNKGILLGQRLIVLDQHQRAFTQFVEGGEYKISFQLPEPHLNGVTLMDAADAERVKSHMEVTAPECSPFVAHDYQVYAQSQADHLNTLIDSMLTANKASNTYVFNKDISTDRFEIKIDTTAGYGYFEHNTRGDECGGGLWFSGLELIEYDGTATLPKNVAEALHKDGYLVGEDFADIQVDVERPHACG